MKKNNTGRNSLIIAVIGLIVVQYCISFGYLDNRWHILLAGFEAATVGGFADWFAVKALFREIPIPFISRHTNIIVKNRAKISKAIVDLVTTEWLSPIVIKEKLANISITNKIINYLKTLDKTKITSFFSKITQSEDFNLFVNKQINTIDIGGLIGGFLKKNISSSAYNDLWTKVLEASQKAIHSDSTRMILQNTVQKQIDTYRDESLVKNLLVNFGTGSKAIDVESITQKLIRAFDDFILDAKANPKSGLRAKIDVYFLDFSHKLTTNDDEVSKFIQNIKKLLINIQWSNLVNDLMNAPKTKSALENQFQNLLTKIENDPKIKDVLDNSIKETISEMVEKSQQFIGNMVMDSLNKLNDKELVAQIENKVGDDLQYIRLNGAIVGGFVGVLIAVIRHLLEL